MNEDKAPPKRHGTEKRQLSQLVPVRCADKERAALRSMAAEAGMSVGAFLRAVALAGPGPRAVRRPSVDRAELARVLGVMRELGAHVNQLAHEANTTGKTPPEATLEGFAARLDELRAPLMVALGGGNADR
jgi:hypothetical protein